MNALSLVKEAESRSLQYYNIGCISEICFPFSHLFLSRCQLFRCSKHYNVFQISGISTQLCSAQIENAHENKWLEMYVITSSKSIILAGFGVGLTSFSGSSNCLVTLLCIVNSKPVILRKEKDFDWLETFQRMEVITGIVFVGIYHAR